MNILVTAGNTQTPLDKVRCSTNIFSGRTGTRVAVEAFDRGHTVTLLTSHPEVLDAIPGDRPRTSPGWQVRTYRTFEELEALMALEFTRRFDAVIHAAAVSDYHVAGILTHDGDRFQDVAAGKVKSSHPELWIKLTPAPKLIDKVRSTWSFRGTLVKFKLEVGVSDAELLAIAEPSRIHSGADLMCANTLDGMHDWAFIGSGLRGYDKVARAELATSLINAVEEISAPTDPSHFLSRTRV
jgi:phosphopantothenate-cysteine ligase/phosphopantothenoylcysteine decarboxylase/phosphopantothenate--cysteine ligase